MINPPSRAIVPPPPTAANPGMAANEAVKTNVVAPIVRALSKKTSSSVWCPVIVSISAVP